jgi:hypothetical protein
MQLQSQMWACTFTEMMEADPLINQFVNRRRAPFFRENPGKVTQSELIRAILDERFFGFLELDIEVPECFPSYTECRPPPGMSPYEYFEEFSPIFTNSEVYFEDYGQHMQTHCIENELSQKPRRLLLGGMKAERIVLITPLIRWYLRHGLRITKIYEAVEYTPLQCFKGFVEQVTEARRKGDNNKEFSNFGDVFKLLGNAAYGSILINKRRYRDVTYVLGRVKACQNISSPRFYNMSELGDGYYEFEMRKRKVRLDTPVVLGLFVLNYAKQRMLEFYFDFMDEYVPRNRFSYLQMDTDSAYISLNGENIFEVMKPSMKKRFMSDLYNQCNDTVGGADSISRWIPRECCKFHKLLDKREPGLFKLEASGDEMICLSSKTYCLSTDNGIKLSCKGISKRTVTNPLDKFRRVLDTKESVCGENLTYSQKRAGFTYFYVKRVICENGIDTKPITRKLTPWSKEELQCMNEECGMNCQLKFFCVCEREWKKDRSIKKYKNQQKRHIIDYTR